MFKGNKKRPKHMQESQLSWLQKVAVKAVVKGITEVATATAMLLVHKYLD